MALKRRYTDEQRASLVVMLESEGYPDRKGALAKVASYAGVPNATLQRWYHGHRNPPPPQMVMAKRLDLAQSINDELVSIFSEMGHKREDADYRSLGTVAGILMDKKFLLEGKATQNINLNLKTYESHTFSPDDWDRDDTATDS